MLQRCSCRGLWQLGLQGTAQLWALHLPWGEQNLRWEGNGHVPRACRRELQTLAPALRLANCSLLMATLALTQMGAH